MVEITKLVQQLEANERIVYLDGAQVVTIEAGISNEGWNVNAYDLSEVLEMLMDLEPIDGGLCTGSARDAIQFV